MRFASEPYIIQSDSRGEKDSSKICKKVAQVSSGFHTTTRSTNIALLKAGALHGRRFLSFSNMLRPTQSFTGLPRWGSGLQRSPSSKGTLTFLGRRSKSVIGAAQGPPSSDPEPSPLEMAPQMTDLMSMQSHVEASHASLSRLRHSSFVGDPPSFTVPQSAPSLHSSQRAGSPFQPFPEASLQRGHAAVQMSAAAGFTAPVPHPLRRPIKASRSTAASQLETVHSVGSIGLGMLETAGSTRSLLPAGPSSSAQGLAFSRNTSEVSQADSSGTSFTSSEAGSERVVPAPFGKPLSRFAHGSS